MCGRGRATRRSTRIKQRQGDSADSRRLGERKTPGSVVAAVAASSPGIPSPIKMPDSINSETNHEIKNNQELVVEKSNLSPKSLNDSESSFIILSKCNGENSNASMINQLNLTQSSSSDSHFSEKKISSIMRENFKLKEMFRHKDNSTRKKLKAIITLDKEIRQICKNYKQHVVEAMEVINQLRKENVRLKPSSTLNLSAEDEDEDEVQSAPTPRELYLIGQLRDLSRQLKDSQDNYLRSQFELNEMKTKFKIEEDNFHETIKKMEEEFKNMKEKISSLGSTDLLHSMTEHWKNELEAKYLTELTTIFKKNLDKNILGETENESNVKEKLHELFKCFTEHCANSLQVENFPDECNKIVRAFKNVEVSFSEEIIDDLKSQNDKLVNCKNALIDDQLQSIQDERAFKNIQIEFLQVYSDYNSISKKMEFFKSEHLKKKNESNTDSDANLENLVEIEKCLMEEKKINDSNKVKLDEERLKIEEEKQNIREERELFDAERISLLEEKESIMEENKEIIDENLYLNRELTKLKEQLASRKDSTSLEEELKTMTAKFNDIKEKLKISLQTNSELSEEISKMMNKDEEIWAYKLQVEMQQNEFHEMHQAEQNFLIQIETLSTDIRELREENARLRQRNDPQPQELV